MIKIQDENGKILFRLEDDSTEPIPMQPLFSCPTCHTDYEGTIECSICKKKEGK